MPEQSETGRFVSEVAENNNKNAYAILGIQKGSTLDEIKQAYVTLVKKYDPERHTDRFMVIQKAFDKLKSPATRAREDVNTFNFIRGEFSFIAEEQTQATDEQIDMALRNLEIKRTAGEIKPEEADAKLVQGLMIRSWKKVQKKLWAEAIQDWQQILKVDPTHRRAKSNLLYSFITLGFSYANHGLYEEAIEVWAQAAQMNPDSDPIIHNLALAYELSGQAEEAGRYWQEVVKRWKAQLEREPDNEYLKSCLIEVLRKHGEQVSNERSPAAPAATGGSGGSATPQQPGAAPQPTRNAKGISEYREILKLNPNDFEAQFKIAGLLMQEHQWAEAVKELDDLRKKYPRNIEVMNLLGWALLNSGKIEDAFMAWRKARVIDPKNYQITESLIKAHMAIGRMLRDKGQFTPCLVHFKALDRYLPDNDEVHYEIGRTYQMKGDERSAFQEFTRVLQLNPKHKAARNGLSTLKLRR